MENVISEEMNREKSSSEDILSGNNANVGIKPNVDENKLSLNFCSFSVFCNFVIDKKL